MPARSFRNTRLCTVEGRRMKRKVSSLWGFSSLFVGKWRLRWCQVKREVWEIGDSARAGQRKVRKDFSIRECFVEMRWREGTVLRDLELTAKGMVVRAAMSKNSTNFGEAQRRNIAELERMVEILKGSQPIRKVRREKLKVGRERSIGAAVRVVIERAAGK